VDWWNNDRLTWGVHSQCLKTPTNLARYPWVLIQSVTSKSLLTILQLHWLAVREWVMYKLGIMMFNYLQYLAPLHLAELCQPVAGFTSWKHLWSATWQLLVVPCQQFKTYYWWAFCAAGPSVWNSLLDSLWDPVIGWNSFWQYLKTFLFTTHWCIQHNGSFTTMCYISQHLVHFVSQSFVMCGGLTHFHISHCSCHRTIVDEVDLNEEHQLKICISWWVALSMAYICCIYCSCLNLKYMSLPVYYNYCINTKIQNCW